MNKNEFTELAYNDHRTALLELWGLCEQMVDAIGALKDELTALKAEQDATQATVLELATAVNAPASK